MPSISISPSLNGRGTLPPCGRENSPYRHPANKDSISTPELGRVFSPAGCKLAWLWGRLIGELYLVIASFGPAGHRRSPESPRAIRNHLWIVIAVGEQGKTDLTPQPGWHDHDNLGAGPVAKAERSANDLVELVEKV